MNLSPDGFDHSRTHHYGTAPAIFGMNFQTISTAQKRPTSDGLTGGYLAGGLTPCAMARYLCSFVTNPRSSTFPARTRFRAAALARADFPSRSA
jgi:hypothetical protein